jgi:hypothetical protein
MRPISRIRVRIQSARSGDLDAGQLFDGGGVAVFVEVRFRHADAADDGEALNEGAPLHQLLEAAVQIADVGLALHHLIAADGQLHRHVAGDAGVVRPLPELEVFARGQVDVAAAVGLLGRVLAAIRFEIPMSEPARIELLFHMVAGSCVSRPGR